MHLEHEHLSFLRLTFAELTRYSSFSLLELWYIQNLFPELYRTRMNPNANKTINIWISKHINMFFFCFFFKNQTSCSLCFKSAFIKLSHLSRHCSGRFNVLNDSRLPLLYSRSSAHWIYRVIMSIRMTGRDTNEHRGPEDGFLNMFSQQHNTFFAKATNSCFYKFFFSSANIPIEISFEKN